MQQIRFLTSQNEFFNTLNKRVNAYFQTNHITRYANGAMVFKTVVMFSLYFVPYGLLVGSVVTSTPGVLLLYVVMGFGIAGIGLSIMHDANHGSYSPKSWLNDLLGFSLNLVGGHAFNWKVQHNVLHHTYTNIEGVDEDITPRGVLRFSPHSAWKPYHRYQYLYAWFFYGLLTFVWVVAKDFERLIKYEREGLVKKQRTTAAKEWAVMLGSKLVYIGYVFYIPMTVANISLGMALAGFFIMHYISGFILAIIFQPAHVIEGTEFPMPSAEGNIDNNWAIHQLHTTTNFAHGNRVLSWYVGGLNYQVEHHLFPNICHVHYRPLSRIVEETAREFGLPYKKKDTFFGALAAHTRVLKMLGQKPAADLQPA
ncbi:MAG: acyl-CoA desaturase [Cyclobacteriaceae bacterium]|nr:acyl-CoA desaturase [Cyclobacteriaceae bacterium]